MLHPSARTLTPSLARTRATLLHSVDSGLPDFRGNEGFWRAYPPLAKLGLQFHEMVRLA